jgi:hypothetical protein
MPDPKFIIQWHGEPLEPLFWSQRMTGERQWSSYRLLFPPTGVPPLSIHLMHFDTEETAAAEAFGLAMRNTHLIGTASVERCWVKRCKVCYDCLCGERR